MIEKIGRDVPKERFTIYLPETTVRRIRSKAVNKKTFSKLVDDAVLSYLDTLSVIEDGDKDGKEAD